MVAILIATPDKIAPAPVDNISYALKVEAVHTPKHLSRVLVVGDSPVIDLSSAVPGAYHGASIDGAPYAMKRCDVLPGDHDPSDFARAIEIARGERFALGILYRRPVDRAPEVAAEDMTGKTGIWPPIGATAGNEFPVESD